MPDYRNTVRKAAPLLPGHTSTEKPIPGKEHLMTRNSDGLFTFVAKDKAKIERFLILGTANGSYYANAPKMTERSLDAINEIVTREPHQVMDVLVAIMSENRAPTRSPALLLCAYLSNHLDPLIRTSFLEYGVSIAKTGSHFLEFVSYLDMFRGWGRAMKSALSHWYTSKTTDQVLFQCTKYANRYGWTHRDVLRKLRIKPSTPEQEAWMGFVTGKPHDASLIPERFGIIETLNHCPADAVSTMDVVELAVNGFDAPREWIPGPILARNYVWEMLFDKGMPETALMRNLGSLGSRMVFDNPKRKQALLERLSGKMSSIHPWQAFLSRIMYERGKGDKGTLTWPVDNEIVTALGKTFINSFKEFKPNGKRKLIAVDMSASMTGMSGQGKTITSPCVQAAALSYILGKSEPNAFVVGFCNEVFECKLDRFTSLSQWTTAVTERTRRGGATHPHVTLELLMHDNQLKNERFDEIIFLTDNEANHRSHFADYLERYRKNHNPNLKYAAIAFAANNFSLVDPNDPLSMDFCGFDASGFNILMDFLNR